jgi:hypothetical protein
MQTVGPSGEVLDDDAHALFGCDASWHTDFVWCGQCLAEVADCLDVAEAHSALRERESFARAASTGGHMSFTAQLVAAIEAARYPQLHELSRDVWRALAAGVISDDQAHTASLVIEERRRATTGGHLT